MNKNKVLDIGCGIHKVSPDAIGLDVVKLEGVDVVQDLEKFPYPFKDDEFDEVHANMILEHLQNFEEAMREVHRILKKDGIFYIKVPFYATTIAFQDYTHKNYFTEKTFTYFTKDNELSYYQDIRFEIVDQKLVSNSNSFYERIRNVIPFRKFLKFILWNMYDELHVVLKKV
jgi:predicted SAM-dependent methyltransferase